MIRQFFASALLLLVITGMGCTNGTDQYSSANSLHDQLIGRWDVREAIFNNRPTDRLSGAYLELLSNGTMYTNLGGTRQQGQWSLDHQTLYQQVPGLEAQYEIVSFQDTLMTATMRIHHFVYKLLLEKAMADTTSQQQLQ